ncbi:MAG: hypothetical protein CSA68_12500 [Rhodobacterales bacterium]|nr:MAG: hypothetical protein CSA68_12500 [Rhodobacterales bacterium]
MSKADQLKWDAKYSQPDHQIEGGEASYMLKRFADQASGKRALDVASGTGRNALYLAARGFEVEALDISPVGLQRLEREAQGLTGVVQTKQVDLEGYVPPRDCYDLIVVTNYLNRPLIPHLGRALRLSGILVMDTFMVDERNQKNTHRPEYLLKRDEFLDYFHTGFEVLQFEDYCREPSGCGMWKQAIAVRRTG